MAKEVRENEVTEIKEEIYYICDKCHGRFHDDTQFEEHLNKVVFGAYASGRYSMPANTLDAHSGGALDADVHGEYEYLLCDRCMESAHEYLRDFF